MKITIHPTLWSRPVFKRPAVGLTMSLILVTSSVAQAPSIPQKVLRWGGLMFPRGGYESPEIGCQKAFEEWMVHNTCTHRYKGVGSITPVPPPIYSAVAQAQCKVIVGPRCSAGGLREGDEYVFASISAVPFPVLDVYQDPPPDSCPAYGKPIHPLTGSEHYTDSTHISLGGQRLQLAYDSLRGALRADEDELQGAMPINGQLGRLWWTNFHRELIIGPEHRSLLAIRGGAKVFSFTYKSGTLLSEASPVDRITSFEGGYLYRDMSSQVLERYGSTGKLVAMSTASGTLLTPTYSTSATAAEVAPGPGYMISLQDSFGRQVMFTYKTLTTGEVVIDKIIDPAGLSIGTSYDANGNLAGLEWPDASRFFVYDSSHPKQEWALTGIIDEAGARYATITYDAIGWARTTELAGGVNKFVVNYTEAPRRVISMVYNSKNSVFTRYHEWIPVKGLTITSPNNVVSNIETQATLVRDPANAPDKGLPRPTIIDQPAGAGCTASTSEISYDSNGSVASRDDFNGRRVCYAYEPGRSLESVRVEGLANTASCSAVLADGASVPVAARKITTQWHPDWALQTRVAEPRRIVTTVYNGQSDPFNGNAIAVCAPAVAKLPDGKPIAVVCKRVEQATTDVDGSKGFAAALAPGAAARQWTYSYNSFGQVLTEDGPRTDVADVTRYEYYADTTANWTKGDLQQVTNPAGQVAQYTKYNPHGQVLEMKDANGVVTTYTYDLRQRLKTVMVGTELTTYDYYPTGLLQRVTQPDASYIEYRYDDAHRLTGLADGLGNSVTYTLDNAGNRTKEEIKDPQGVLTRNLGRAFDALGRLQSATGTLQ
ncbi:hypothetical protein OOT46_07435 [Aquabacterium sp. A7-Y]|uniref:RHS repeat domain-containing protein n=1 Tax=Aquabacterium sp. A7-Y TaxID=1349605 RepID=UPI00223DD523|nr:hypothetical protein [Aquabacterium sp. A7-Y]MCW7537681.1 hypothetical protein [Aquabacterium sp. A7-Y]